MVLVVAAFRRLGLQKRITLYVTVGLVIIFGGFTYVGFLSLRQATDLVYLERLSSAHITAGVLERDFLHVARDVDEVSMDLITGDPERLRATAQSLFDHLSQTDPFPFFRVTGVWVLAPEGLVWAIAGEPGIRSSEQVTRIASSAGRPGHNRYEVIPGVGAELGSTPFGTIVVEVPDPSDSDILLVAVHTASINSAAPYVPADYWRTVPAANDVGSRQSEAYAEYHIEVVDPTGLIVLGIGDDEIPGEMSHHLPVIQSLMAQGKASTILHEPSSGNDFEHHVIALVPLGSSPFYVIQEQTPDAALALPLELRRRVLLVATFGFVATLLIAWLNTRQVTKPIEQLTSAAQRISQGDLTSSIKVSAQDEVGDLAESLESMRQQLKDAYQNISQAKEELEIRVSERTARLTDVLGRVISAQEEERRRLARELHDETAQTVGALSIALDRARYSLQDNSPDTTEHIQEARGVVRRLLDDTRRLILDLRPMALEDLGMVAAIRWYAESHLQERGVETTIEVDHPAARLPQHLEISLFRIAQEAINNVARHAQARKACIRLSLCDSTARIEITDDGNGFNVEDALHPGLSGQGVGLLGMQERARLLSGSFELHSEAGKGARVTVEVPILSVEKQQ